MLKAKIVVLEGSIQRESYWAIELNVKGGNGMPVQLKVPRAQYRSESEDIEQQKRLVLASIVRAINDSQINTCTIDGCIQLAVGDGLCIDHQV